MKSKKHLHEKEAGRTAQHHSQRQPVYSKTGLTKRSENSQNKQRKVLVTEPLDINPSTYFSKDFILSRQSIGSGSRSALKDVSRNLLTTQKSTEFKPHHQQREQEMFDRRLSLKCTDNNYSQQLDYQKSQRLSMAPLRRESTFIHSNIPPHIPYEERQSMSSIYQNSLMSDTKSRQTIKKEKIITNLMSKLDNEADLKSIIEMKLRNSTNVSYQNFSKDKRNHSYITDFTEENSNQSMAYKLKQCVSEISYFKTVIREMSEKIVELTEEKKSSQKKTSTTVLDGKDPVSSRQRIDSEVLSMLRKAGQSSCENCERRQKKTKQIAIQANPSQKQPTNVQGLDQSLDFLDNLEKTLNVLDGRKQ